MGSLCKYKFTGDPENEYQVYTFIHDTDSRGHLFNERVFKKLFPTIYTNIMKMNWEPSWPFSQVLYHYFLKYTNISEESCGTCRNCGAQTKFISFKKGYLPYCSSKCANSNKDKKQKCIDTCIDKYGVSNASEAESVKQKAIETCINKYGVYHASQAQSVKDKTKSTCQERYGVDSPFQMNDFHEKASNTFKRKYGVEWNTKSPIIKDKTKSTCQERYGVDNPSFSQDVVNKRHSTMIEHFGMWYTCTDDMVENNHKLFLQRHPDIIGESEHTYTCSCGSCHDCELSSFEIDKSTYKQRSSYGYIICPIKSPINSTKSMREIELLSFIKSIYPGEIIEGDRSVLGKKELDIYIPEKHIAFEFNGVFWHSDFSGKPNNYHQQKSIDCLNKGITLVHVWEDDWVYKQDIVKDFISAKLGCINKSIYARDCDITAISTKEARQFFETNHLQGYVGSTYKIGLIHNGEIVSAMLIGCLRKSMGSAPKTDCYEIYRFASKRGYEVTGGFSKLLKYFERTYKPRAIITYADMSITTGNVYTKCGFSQESISPPCYSWAIGGRRFHRTNFMKSRLQECIDNPALTENQVMRSRGAYKVWDSGKIKFIKQY